MKRLFLLLLLLFISFNTFAEAVYWPSRLEPKDAEMADSTGKITDGNSSLHKIVYAENRNPQNDVNAVNYNGVSPNLPVGVYPLYAARISDGNVVRYNTPSPYDPTNYRDPEKRLSIAFTCTTSSNYPFSLKHIGSVPFEIPVEFWLIGANYYKNGNSTNVTSRKQILGNGIPLVIEEGETVTHFNIVMCMPTEDLYGEAPAGVYWVAFTYTVYFDGEVLYTASKDIRLEKDNKVDDPFVSVLVFNNSPNVDLREFAANPDNEIKVATLKAMSNIKYAGLKYPPTLQYYPVDAYGNISYDGFYFYNIENPNAPVIPYQLIKYGGLVYSGVRLVTTPGYVFKVNNKEPSYPYLGGVELSHSLAIKATDKTASAVKTAKTGSYVSNIKIIVTYDDRNATLKFDDKGTVIN